MNTETQVPTVEETQNPPTETVEVKPEVTAQDATPGAVNSGEEKPDPHTIELKRLERELRKAQRNNARLYQELGAAREQTKAVPQEQPDTDVNTRAEQIAEAKLFAQTAERIVEGGKKSNPDFIEKLQDLRSEVGDFVLPNGLPSRFMQAVLDVSEKPTDLLYYLGKNPDIAGELSDLPVTKLAARLDRIERSLATPQPKQSSAPKPLEPVKSKSSDSGLHSDLSTEEWMKRREAEVRERRKY